MVKPARNDAGNFDTYLDSDIWITTNGTTSYPHYDIQHNFYTVITGRKLFSLLSPDMIVDNNYSFHLFPYHHPRQRQIQNPGLFSSVLIDKYSNRESSIVVPAFSVVTTVDISPGDVLYIPPFWVHSGSSIGLTIALGTCLSSVAEVFIDRIEQLALPFELTWSFSKRLFALFRFVDVLIREFRFPEIASIQNVSQFMSNLFSSRYRNIFSDENIFAMDQSVNNVVTNICAGNLSYIQVNGNGNDLESADDKNIRGAPTGPYYMSHFDVEFTRRASEVIRPLRQVNISFSVLRIIIDDTVEQWANFLLPEAVTPVVFALCRDITNL